MQPEEAIEYIYYLRDKEIDEKLYLRWALAYQEEMSFNDFKAHLVPVKIKKDEEILENVFEIIRKTREVS